MAGDNGKELTPQEPKQETPQNSNPAPEIVEVLRIGLNKKTNQVVVQGLLGNKKLCLTALGEAVKTVANFEPSPIIQPPKPHGILNFAKRFRS